MVTNNHIPTYHELFKPLMQALAELGGSGTIEEIFQKVVDFYGITDNQLGILHQPEKGGITEIEYRLAWSRTYLKKYGLIENSGRGVWALTSAGREIGNIDPQKIVREVRKMNRKEQKIEDEEEILAPTSTISWRTTLFEILLSMDFSAFERLIQRMLRECGFTQVEVTGRTGDGGIDGKGIMRLGGLLSFHVVFQCKRYKGSISASQIRDFRGAMMGRADKGLFVTTGNFTKDAVTEATRDGATPIDLIDGDQLVEKLKDLTLGVKKEIIQQEKITVDRQWYEKI